ncbi:unnamed protein product [Pylaiella littoralis]
MVVLAYSRGRGRVNATGRGGRSFSTSSRGRGRGRSLTWTRPDAPSNTSPPLCSTQRAPPPVGRPATIPRASARLPRDPIVAAVTAAAPRAGGNNRIWINKEGRVSDRGGDRGTNSSSRATLPQRPTTMRRPSAVAAATAPALAVPNHHSPHGSSAAFSKMPKSVNRVWKNTSSGSSSSTAQNAVVGITTALGGGEASAGGDTNKAASLSKSKPAVSGTGMGRALSSSASAAPRNNRGNLVWTKAGPGGAAGTISRTRISVVNRPSVPAETAVSSKAPRPAQVGPAAGSAPVTGGAAGSLSQILASPPAFIVASSKTPAAVRPNSATAVVSSSLSPTRKRPVSRYSGSTGRDLISKGQQLKATAKVGAAASAPAAAAPAVARLITKRVARYSGSASLQLQAQQQLKSAATAAGAPARRGGTAATAAAPAPATSPASQFPAPTKPVVRYSGLVAGQQPKAASSKHENAAGQQQVARYSGAARGGARSNGSLPFGRGGSTASGPRSRGRGRGMPAWRGGGGRCGRGGRKAFTSTGASSGGYYNWPLGSRRGLPAWRGPGAWGYDAGGRLCGGSRSRYPVWAPIAARFRTHPATAARRTAGRWAHPWAGRAAYYWAGRGRGRGRGRGPFTPAAGRSRKLSQGKPVRYKNRTLIRARSLLPQPPVVARAALLSGPIAAAAAAAAARRAAIARRATFGASGRSTKSGKFVRSGKHGMTIRRVNSSDLAARRAAAAATPASSPAAKRLKVSIVSTGAHKTAVAGASGKGSGKGVETKRLPTAGVVKAIAGGRSTATGAVSKKASPSSTSASSSKLVLRKAALLSKARARSSVAARKAAVVVAGARAKRSRLQLVRNMTLYRGKGQTAVTGSSSGGGKRAAAAAVAKKKKVHKTSEPCLFFCRFGKCSKSDEECRYVHDKTKVAVCRAFLRKGGCDKGDKCLLTHAVQAEKMPVCIYFEKGMCFTPNCPYLHVKVSRNAAVCPSFLKGYCPDGTACRLKHELPDPRKRARDDVIGVEQGGDDDKATSSKKRKTEPASEKDGVRSPSSSSSSPSTAATEVGGSYEGKSGESGLRSPKRAAPPPVGGSGGRGVGPVGVAVLASGDASTAAAAAAAAAFAAGGGLSPPPPQKGLVEEGVDWKPEALQGADDDDDDDDDLKPVFLRKRKRK